MPKFFVGGFGTDHALIDHAETSADLFFRVRVTRLEDTEAPFGVLFVRPGRL